MGYRLNRLDEPIFKAVSKPLLTEFGIHHRLESIHRLDDMALDGQTGRNGHFFVIGLTCQSENVSFMMPVDDDILWAEEVVAWGLAEVTTTAPSSSSSSDSFRI